MSFLQKFRVECRCLFMSPLLLHQHGAPVDTKPNITDKDAIIFYFRYDAAETAQLHVDEFAYWKTIINLSYNGLVSIKNRFSGLVSRPTSFYWFGWTNGLVWLKAKNKTEKPTGWPRCRWVELVFPSLVTSTTIRSQLFVSHKIGSSCMFTAASHLIYEPRHCP